MIVLLSTFQGFAYHDSDGILPPYDYAYKQTILITINPRFKKMLLNFV